MDQPVHVRILMVQTSFDTFLHEQFSILLIIEYPYNATLYLYQGFYLRKFAYLILICLLYLINFVRQIWR